jgi:hypothetical protein
MKGCRICKIDITDVALAEPGEKSSHAQNTYADRASDIRLDALPSSVSLFGFVPRLKARHRCRI